MHHQARLMQSLLHSPASVAAAVWPFATIAFSAGVQFTSWCSFYHEPTAGQSSLDMQIVSNTRLYLDPNNSKPQYRYTAHCGRQS
jgi:hypothetical protein